ncbi:MAG: DnaB helicase C-terminal domain-containing protein [Candidatus Mariimomonas ferrooxydans]
MVEVVWSGVFSITDCYNELQSVTGVTNRNNYRVILNRLKRKGIIERSGNKDGIFRKVNDEAEDIDYKNADVKEININLPFNLHTLINIYPKNVLVIAGVPDAGKTAFLLNIVEMNMVKHEIYYFSSEMAGQELRLRLSKFKRDLTTWKFHPKERVYNFADVIKPDALNIIDYLEVHDEFYKVGGMIKQISDKLNKGIALVAIQKNKGSEYGLGASRGLEMPRLYLTLNPGQAKIEKAKNWVDPLKNPNGLMLNFKLFQGCKFSIERDWHKE